MSDGCDDESNLVHVRRMLDMESARYVGDRRWLSEPMRHYAIPVSMYVMCCSIALPVKTIMIGERPYATGIHPPVSSAMSYDPRKCRSTPSTIGAPSDLSRTTGCTYLEAEKWFRGSWKYLNSGTIVVNCTVVSSYSSSHSINEVVSFQKWLRCIIKCSSRISQSTIDVVCMGVPSQNIVDSTLSSMDSHKGVVKKKMYPNPTSWSKRNQEPRDTL